ncbi:MAG: PAS domain S-box protein [Desulfomonile tiedjei]|uniref:PAS domain S-box protein n=1 Tax=Desulfomonile tiedjei TaxID=2358 RepID=A0A9D6V2F3_9BACT|nr:PAS domain S-box protein [Desulfomonile tiedjei]
MTHMSKTNPVRILICQDEGIIAEDIAVSLKSLGYEVVGLVSTGEEAIRIAEEARPDLILMDIKLQGEMQGVTACQRILSSQDVPVIYISAHHEPDTVERIKMSRPYGYLSSPVSAHELKSNLEIALYRHQADKRVRESEERLRSTLDSLHDFVFVLDGNGDFTDFHCPPTLLSKLYVTPDRFIGRHFQDVLPHDVVRLLNEAIILVERHGLVEHFDYRMVIEGEECFFSAKVSARKTLSGNFDGVTIVSSDITDRKRGEEALRESQERYRTIFDGSRDGFVMVDIKGRIIDANQSYCEMLGYSLNELQELADFYSITPAHWRQWESEEIWQKRLLGNGYSGVYEMEYIRKDGSVFPVELQSYAVFDESRTPRYLWGVARDMTEHRKALKALEESERLYRSLVETTDTGFVVIDEQGRVLDANSEYVRLTGRTSMDEIKGRLVLEWTAEHDKQRNAREVSLCLSNGFVRNLEIDYVDTEGNLVPIEINATVVKGELGIRIVTLCRGIIERKKAEEQIRESLKEKEVLLREIHHRVKNNLAVVSSLLRFQGRHAKDEYHRRMFLESQDRIRSMALAHEKLYQSDNLSEINSRNYLSSLAEHLMAGLGHVGSNVKLQLQIAEIDLDLETCVTLGFIVTEMVNNSLKHGFPDGRTGKISVILREIEESILELSVADDGVGLPENIQIQNPGTLGLDLVRIFSRQLRGQLEVRRDRGTEVILSFNLRS